MSCSILAKPLHSPPIWLPEDGGQRELTCQDPFDTLVEFLSQYKKIGLDELSQVALLDRLDVKYAFPLQQMEDLLKCFPSNYRILTVNGRLFQHYHTQYFDTPDFRFYYDHVNKRAERFKVRCREYTDSGVSFLELKHNNRKDRTIKHRQSLISPITHISKEHLDWLNNFYPSSEFYLEPKIRMTFSRLTLTDNRNCERITLDTDIQFITEDSSIKLSGLVVAEAKMDKLHRESPFMLEMHKRGNRRIGLSKYTLGTALLENQVKKNDLKPKILLIERILRGASYD